MKRSLEVILVAGGGLRLWFASAKDAAAFLGCSNDRVLERAHRKIRKRGNQTLLGFKVESKSTSVGPYSNRTVFVNGRGKSRGP